MTCVHLRQLVELCQDSDIRLSSSDLIHMVCHKCNMHEVCPSELVNLDKPELEGGTKTAGNDSDPKVST